MDFEEQMMTLIVNAGMCRSLLMNALSHAREGEIKQANQLVSQAEAALVDAHHIQTQLIEQDQGEGKLKVNIILVHAQDHLMNAVLLMDLAKEMIMIYQRLPQ